MNCFPTCIFGRYSLPLWQVSCLTKWGVLSKQKRFYSHETYKSALSYMLKSIQLPMQIRYSKAKHCYGTDVAPAHQRSHTRVWFSMMVWKISYQKQLCILIDRSGLWFIRLAKLSCCIWIQIAKISTNVIVESHRLWFMSMIEKPQKVWRFPASTQKFGYFSSFSQPTQILLF